MQTLNLVQGSQEWLSARAKYRTASEAPIMTGVSKNVKRGELIRIYATGDAIEISEFVERVVFPKGHDVERMARPIAERIIGDELYPVTAVDDNGYLLASFDGITMLESVTWECKQWNEGKAELVRNGVVPEEDRPQVIQQLVVSGAEKALYMVTDGTEEKTVYTWYTLGNGDHENLIAGWKQFDADVANYKPVETQPEVVGRAPDTLPALHVEVKGMVTASNLEEFKANALAVFSGINKSLSTDRDFADAEKTVKWCKDVEERLEAAKAHALSQTSDIDTLFRTIDTIKEEARTTRLELDKLVTARKKQVREEIWQEANRAMVDHIHQINAGLDGIRMPEIAADFAGAMKGKKTITGLRDGVDTELARAKVAANQVADKIRANLVILAENADHALLFADRQHLVLKEPEDLRNLIAARIAEHKQAEERRAERERERIEAEQKKLVEEHVARMEEAETACEPIAAPKPERQKANPINADIKMDIAAPLYTVSVASYDNIQIEMPGGRIGLCLVDAIKLRNQLDAAIKSAQEAA